MSIMPPLRRPAGLWLAALTLASKPESKSRATGLYDLSWSRQIVSTFHRPPCRCPPLASTHEWNSRVNGKWHIPPQW